MHFAAYDFVADAVVALGPFRSVVEIGSRDLNGSVRDLFPETDYIGLDVEPGAGVDVVVDPAVEWNPPDLVDVVVCCEVLEHLENWPDLLVDAARYLKGGGTLILTAAGPGRRPHSGITGRRALEPGEHYANIDPDTLGDVLALVGFQDLKVDVASADVRATATRRARTVVGVPFLDELERTARVIEWVLDDPATDLLILDDNGSDRAAVDAWADSVARDPRVVLNRRGRLEDGLSLYEVWNDVVAAARALDPGLVNVALLNNDLRLWPGTIGLLADALRRAPADVAAVYPDYRRTLLEGLDLTGLTPTRGAWSKKGLSGFCFMFRGELMGATIPFFDTRYRLIYGDGDFVEDLEAAGMTAARVDGLPLEHDKSTTLNAQRRWAAGVKRADTETRKAKVAAR